MFMHVLISFLDSQPQIPRERSGRAYLRSFGRKEDAILHALAVLEAPNMVLTRNGKLMERYCKFFCSFVLSHC